MIPTATIPEGQYPTLIARLVDETGQIVQQSDVEAISLQVRDLGTNEIVGDHSLAKASVIFDAYQTGYIWDVDSTGYNFKYTVDTPHLTVPGGKRYRFEVEVRRSSGGPIKQAWEVAASRFEVSV